MVFNHSKYIHSSTGKNLSSTWFWEAFRDERKHLIHFTDSPWGCKKKGEKNKEMCLSFTGKNKGNERKWRHDQEGWLLFLNLSASLKVLPDKIAVLFPNTFLHWCFTEDSCLVSNQPEKQIKKKIQFEGIFESQERNQKHETNADIRYYKLFTGNKLDIVLKDHFGTPENLWMFKMRRLNQKSNENFKQQRLKIAN